MKRFLILSVALGTFWATVVASAFVLVQPYRFAVAGSWVPTDEAKLVRWIAADALGGGLSDGDPISTAADQSGLGNDITGSGTARPTYETGIVNGLPGMLFNAAQNDRLNGSAIASGDSVKTWAIVYQADADARAVMGTKSGMANYTNFGGAGYFGEFRAARIDTYPATVPTSGVVVVVGVSSGSTYEVWVNGTSAGAQSANFDAGDLFHLGAGGNSSNDWNNYVYEFLEFNVSADSTLRVNIQTYLARWQ